jgi:hypothetical protein
MPAQIAFDGAKDAVPGGAIRRAISRKFWTTFGYFPLLRRSTKVACKTVIKTK